jgi:hypothetical protein
VLIQTARPREFGEFLRLSLFDDTLRRRNFNKGRNQIGQFLTSSPEPTKRRM